jgi:hypothetical protein
MIFSNEYWELVVIPQYVRKDSSKIKVDCVHCKGSGIVDNPDAMGLMDIHMKCFYCWGDGKREVLPEIPPPPEIDNKFLEDLKEWFENYKGLEQK